LHQSAKEGNNSKIQDLVNNGVEINERTEGGLTALHLASSHGNINTIKLF